MEEEDSGRSATGGGERRPSESLMLLASRGGEGQERSQTRPFLVPCSPSLASLLFSPRPPSPRSESPLPSKHNTGLTSDPAPVTLY